MKYANINDDPIKIYDDYPAIWLNDINFRATTPEEKYSAGFRTVIYPEINNLTHYLGDIFYDAVNDYFTYPELERTAEETDLAIEVNDENIAGRQTDKHLEAGQDLQRKCYRRIWRRKNLLTNSDNNKLSRPRARALMKFLNPTYSYLFAGNFDAAYDEISQMITDNLTELEATTGMINTAEWLQIKILDYRDSSEYDL